MAYGLNEVKTYEHMAYESNSVDEVVDEFSHLRLNDEQYRTLHCWHAQRLGVDRFRGLAKEAERLGKNPARYFTYLLKKAR
jgi:adenylosuccinate synthase